MHETNPIEKEIRAEAERISHRHGGAPVVIIVGESRKAGIARCMTGSTLHHGEEFTTMLGVLEAAKQIETYKHLVQPRKDGKPAPYTVAKPSSKASGPTGTKPPPPPE